MQLQKRAVSNFVLLVVYIFLGINDVAAESWCKDYCNPGTYISDEPNGCWLQVKYYCTWCPDGQSSSGGGSGVTSCYPCPAGKYESRDSVSQRQDCLVCPAGTYSASSGWQDGCNSCKPGKYGPSSLEGLSACLDCPAGTQQPNNHATSLSDCVECASGKYSTVPIGCTDCSAGKYATSTGQTECDLCDYGTYTNAIAQTICALCSTGKHQDGLGKTICKDCEVGKRSLSEGHRYCAYCYGGKYADVEGLNTRCFDCEIGKYRNYYEHKYVGHQCYNCTLGHIPDELQNECIECEKGKTTFQPGEATCQVYAVCAHPTDPNLPPSVDYCPDDTREQKTRRCPANQYMTNYQDVYGMHKNYSICAWCPEGTYMDAWGLVYDNSTLEAYCPKCTEAFSNVEDCPSPQKQLIGVYARGCGGICSDCKAGEFLSEEGSHCQQCPQGTYRMENHTIDDCIPCVQFLQHSTTIAAGSETVDDCVCRQSFILHNGVCMCAAGFYAVASAGGNQGEISCEITPFGTYTTEPNLQYEPYPCPDLNTSNRGSTSIYNCTCMEEKTCNLCSAGHYFIHDSGNTTCLPCEAGTYSSSPGFTACLGCEPGKYQPYANASYCYACADGTYSDDGIVCLTCDDYCQDCKRPFVRSQLMHQDTSCMLCMEGYVKMTTGKHECKMCPNGKFHNISTNNCDECPRERPFSHNASFSKNHCFQMVHSEPFYAYSAIPPSDRNYDTLFMGMNECPYNTTKDHLWNISRIGTQYSKGCIISHVELPKPFLSMENDAWWPPHMTRISHLTGAVTHPVWMQAFFVNNTMCTENCESIADEYILIRDAARQYGPFYFIIDHYPSQLGVWFDVNAPNLLELYMVEQSKLSKYVITTQSRNLIYTYYHDKIISNIFPFFAQETGSTVILLSMDQTLHILKNDVVILPPTQVRNSLVHLDMSALTEIIDNFQVSDAHVEPNMRIFLAFGVDLWYSFFVNKMDVAFYFKTRPVQACNSTYYMTRSQKCQEIEHEVPLLPMSTNNSKIHFYNAVGFDYIGAGYCRDENGSRPFILAIHEYTLTYEECRTLCVTNDNCIGFACGIAKYYCVLYASTDQNVDPQSTTTASQVRDIITSTNVLHNTNAEYECYRKSAKQLRAEFVNVSFSFVGNGYCRDKQGVRPEFMFKDMTSVEHCRTYCLESDCIGYILSPKFITRRCYLFYPHMHAPLDSTWLVHKNVGNGKDVNSIYTDPDGADLFCYKKDLGMNRIDVMETERAMIDYDETTEYFEYIGDGFCRGVDGTVPFYAYTPNMSYENCRRTCLLDTACVGFAHGTICTHYFLSEPNLAPGWKSSSDETTESTWIREISTTTEDNHTDVQCYRTKQRMTLMDTKNVSFSFLGKGYCYAARYDTPFYWYRQVISLDYCRLSCAEINDCIGFLYLDARHVLGPMCHLYFAGYKEAVSGWHAIMRASNITDASTIEHVIPAQSALCYVKNSFSDLNLVQNNVKFVFVGSGLCRGNNQDIEPFYFQNSIIDFEQCRLNCVEDKTCIGFSHTSQYTDGNFMCYNYFSEFMFGHQDWKIIQREQQFVFLQTPEDIVQTTNDHSTYECYRKTETAFDNYRRNVKFDALGRGVCRSEIDEIPMNIFQDSTTFPTEECRHACESREYCIGYQMYYGFADKVRCYNFVNNLWTQNPDGWFNHIQSDNPLAITKLGSNEDSYCYRVNISSDENFTFVGNGRCKGIDTELWAPAIIRYEVWDYECRNTCFQHENCSAYMTRYFSSRYMCALYFFYESPTPEGWTKELSTDTKIPITNVRDTPTALCYRRNNINMMRTPPQNTQMVPYFDFVGHGYAHSVVGSDTRTFYHFTKVEDANECRQYCVEDSDCVGYATFLNTESNCYTYYSIQKQNAVGWNIIPSDIQYGFDIYGTYVSQDTDLSAETYRKKIYAPFASIPQRTFEFIGNGLCSDPINTVPFYLFTHDISREACRYKCLLTNDCIGFSHLLSGHEWGSRCYLYFSEPRQKHDAWTHGAITRWMSTIKGVQAHRFAECYSKTTFAAMTQQVVCDKSLDLVPENYCHNIQPLLSFTSVCESTKCQNKTITTYKGVTIYIPLGRNCTYHIETTELFGFVYIKFSNLTFARDTEILLTSEEGHIQVGDSNTKHKKVVIQEQFSGEISMTISETIAKLQVLTPRFSSDMLTLDLQPRVDYAKCQRVFSKLVPQCKMCPAYTFKSHKSALVCNRCSANSYFTPAEVGGIPQCRCIPPFLKIHDRGSQKCAKCMENHYLTRTFSDGTVINTCNPCKSNSVSKEGYNEYCMCPGNDLFYDNNDICQVCDENSKHPSCGCLASNCACDGYAVNTITSASTTVSFCVKCAPGKYANSNMASCVSCEEGKYSPTFGASGCTKCLPGTNTTNVGSIACIPETLGHNAFSEHEFLHTAHRNANDAQIARGAIINSFEG